MASAALGFGSGSGLNATSEPSCASFNFNSTRPSCELTSFQFTSRDAVSVLRIVAASLSILGTISIIISAIITRRVKRPEVHPIFMLSIADCLLAVLWVIGSSFWLNTDGLGYSSNVCFSISIITIIMECVTINLTLVYAILAYVIVRQSNSTRREVYTCTSEAILQSDLHTNYFRFDDCHKNTSRPWSYVLHPCTAIGAYLIAWILPVLIVLIPFGIISQVTNVVQEAKTCSCWCSITFENVLPHAFSLDAPTSYYVFDLGKIILTFGIVVAGNYFVAFPLLIVLYYKILKGIKMLDDHKCKNGCDRCRLHNDSVVTSMTQVSARRRIIYILLVFIATGSSNFILALSVVVTQAINLSEGVRVTDSGAEEGLIFFLYFLQAVTIPLQGFLNAIVYGWTRTSFRHTILMRNKPSLPSAKEDDLDHSEHVAMDVSNHDRHLTVTAFTGSLSTE